MSGSKGGFSVDVSLKDNASATVDKLSGKFGALSKRVEELGKKSAGVGESSNGLARVGEGMKGFGDKTLDAFRSMDRLVPAMGALTGAASLAGMTALVSKFGEFGHSIEMMSYRLSVPVGRLNALEQGARLAGASTGALDRGMATLGDRLSGAHWGRDSDAVRLFRSLGVEFDTAAGGARNADDALGDVAEAVKKLPDPRTQARVVRELFGGEELLPFLRKGREGIAEYTAMVAKYGGTITPEMAQRGEALEMSVLHLSTAATGLGNTIASALAPEVTALNEWLAVWIARNKELVATKITTWVDDIGRSLKGLSDWVSAHPQIAGFVFGAAVGARVGGAPGALIGGLVGSIPGGPMQPSSDGASIPSPSTYQAPPEPYSPWKPWTYIHHAPDAGTSPPATPGHIPFSWADPHSWLQGRSPVAPSSTQRGAIVADPNPGGGARGLRNNNPLNLSYVPGQGGVLGRESGANHQFGVYGTMASGIAAEARQLLRYQDANGLRTVHDIVKRWVSDPNFDQTSYENDVARSMGKKPTDQIDLHDPAAMAAYIRGAAPHESGRVSDDDISRGVNMAFGGPPLGNWNTPTGAASNAMGATQTAGTVTVDVHLHNAPPGTMVVASSSGPVRVPPPRVDTALPGVH